MAISRNWKKDPVQDHFLDSINVKRFHSKSCTDRIRYIWPFLMTILTLLVYASDIWTAINLCINKDRASKSYFGEKSSEWFAYVFYFSISASILLALWEIHRAWRILYSRDVAFIFTDPIANRFHVLLSYCNFCFFDKIAASRSIQDQITFFVYFRLKSWKRLFFVQVPREIIKGFVIYHIVSTLFKNLDNFKELLKSFSTNEYVSYLSIGSLLITHLMFIYAALMTIIAGLFYIPLACEIRGNLKEYCCYRVDKKVSLLLLQRSHNVRRKKLNPSNVSNISSAIDTPKPAYGMTPQRQRVPSIDASSIWSQDTVNSSLSRG